MRPLCDVCVAYRKLFLFSVFAGLLILQVYAGSARAQQIKLVFPSDSETVLAKRPRIECELSPVFSSSDLLVLLDGTDVTELIQITQDGFSYHPFQVLPAGPHILSVSGVNSAGESFAQDFHFTTRHMKLFETAFSDNRVSAVYEQAISKPHSDPSPDRKLEANLETGNEIRNNAWVASFESNARYLDQNTSVQAPLEKGLNLINYLARLSYARERMEMDLELGDVLIDESRNTVQGLGRSGGKFRAKFGDYTTLSGFIVSGEQEYAYDQGLGIGTDSDEHIMGGAVEIGLPSTGLRLKTLYVSGGEPGSSFGLWDPGGGQKGDVLGIVLSSSFWDNQFNFEAEADFSDYDPDTSDEFQSEQDEAYRIGLNGYWDRYSFEAQFEQYGSDYAVIGNPGALKDWRGVTLRGGVRLDKQSFDLSVLRAHDNVDSDPLYPRITTTQGHLDYRFDFFPSFPMGISYRKSLMESTDEPDYTPPTDQLSDELLAQVHYLHNDWDFGFEAAYSVQNDRTSDNADSESISLTFLPAYYGEHLYASGAVSWLRSRDHFSDIQTDTTTANLDLRGNLGQTYSYEVSATASKLFTDDSSLDERSFNGFFQFLYRPEHRFSNFFNISLGIQGSYQWREDKVYDDREDEFRMMFVILNDTRLTL